MYWRNRSEICHIVIESEKQFYELVHPGHDPLTPQVLNTTSAGDVPRSSFGMVLRPGMTQ